MVSTFSASNISQLFTVTCRTKWNALQLSPQCNTDRLWESAHRLMMMNKEKALMCDTLPITTRALATPNGKKFIIRKCFCKLNSGWGRGGSNLNEEWYWLIITIKSSPTTLSSQSFLSHSFLYPSSSPPFVFAPSYPPLLLSLSPAISPSFLFHLQVSIHMSCPLVYLCAVS